MPPTSPPPRPRARRSPPPPDTEHEPLLGRPGDALLPPNTALHINLYLGTAPLTLLGLVLLLTIIPHAILTHPRLPLVSPHPLLQTLGYVLLVLAILILQPTSSLVPEAKRRARAWHAALQGASAACFVAGVAVIEANKMVNKGVHFHSAHGVLGAASGVVLVGQYAFGVVMWLVPGVVGVGEERARGWWRWHRYSGYAVLVLLTGTVVSAAATPYVGGVLEVKMWMVVLAGVLVLAGVFPRVQLGKMREARV
ncbi:eukaryotic cytochrome b561-domain-containing protein [Schizothecium vesticola]|uniref:Eukaryotic cytochrome b561-domain-containing protein n=1 Tax=Schizothecium vesticola TaxID=314040 RepID=A0AA40EKF9_9PEZI|nr:eukaryotic cytochrome b561-domain-containing protein [Schizothecium vesticola]